MGNKQSSKKSKKEKPPESPQNGVSGDVGGGGDGGGNKKEDHKLDKITETKEANSKASISVLGTRKSTAIPKTLNGDSGSKLVKEVVGTTAVAATLTPNAIEQDPASVTLPSPPALPSKSSRLSPTVSTVKKPSSSSSSSAAPAESDESTRPSSVASTATTNSTMSKAILENDDPFSSSSSLSSFSNHSGDGTGLSPGRPQLGEDADGSGLGRTGGGKSPFPVNMGLLRSTSMVMKPTMKTKFVDKNKYHTAPDRWKKSLTERIRELDEVKTHMPVTEEREALNLNEERLSIHSMQAVLQLCGGMQGVRFEGEQLKKISALCKNCEDKFKKIEDDYKQLPASKKAMRLQRMYDVNELPSDLPKAGSVDDSVLLGYLHAEIDNYLYIMAELQDLVREVSSHLPSEEEKNQFRKLKNPDVAEGSLTQPVWLTVLLHKYDQIATGLSPAPVPIKKLNEDGEEIEVVPDKISIHSKLKVTVGKFAAFLSCLAIGRFSVNVDEKEAFVTMLHASNDNLHFCSTDDRDPRAFIQNVNAQHLDKIEGRFDQVAAMKYWATRFFNFLRNQSDLKSMFTDEKSVHAFDLFH